jgi:hypothetical protein
VRREDCNSSTACSTAATGTSRKRRLLHDHVTSVRTSSRHHFTVFSTRPPRPRLHLPYCQMHYQRDNLVDFYSGNHIALRHARASCGQLARGIGFARPSAVFPRLTILLIENTGSAVHADGRCDWDANMMDFAGCTSRAKSVSSASTQSFVNYEVDL